MHHSKCNIIGQYKKLCYTIEFGSKNWVLGVLLWLENNFAEIGGFWGEIRLPKWIELTYLLNLWLTSNCCSKSFPRIFACVLRASLSQSLRFLVQAEKKKRCLKSSAIFSQKNKKKNYVLLYNLKIYPYRSICMKLFLKNREINLLILFFKQNK